MNRNLDKLRFARFADFRREFDSSIDRRRNSNAFEVTGCHGLEPNSLPDSRGARVENTRRCWLPMLFAARNVTVGRRIFRSNRHNVIAGLQRPCNIARKRRVPAFMPRHDYAVDPYGCTIVDSPEVQPYASPRPRRGNFKMPPVPDARMKGGIANAALL